MLSLIFPSVPALVDFVLSAFIAVGLMWVVFQLGSRFLGLVTGQDPVQKAIHGLLREATGRALKALDDYIETLDLEAQEAAALEAARRTYASLPDTIIVPIKGKPIPIPLKMIVSEELFVGIVKSAWDGIEELYKEAKKAVDQAYEDWKAVAI